MSVMDRSYCINILSIIIHFGKLTKIIIPIFTIVVLTVNRGRWTHFRHWEEKTWKKDRKDLMKSNVIYEHTKLNYTENWKLKWTCEMVYVLQLHGIEWYKKRVLQRFYISQCDWGKLLTVAFYFREYLQKSTTVRRLL